MVDRVDNRSSWPSTVITHSLVNPDSFQLPFPTSAGGFDRVQQLTASTLRFEVKHCTIDTHISYYHVTTSLSPSCSIRRSEWAVRSESHVLSKPIHRAWLSESLAGLSSWT